MVQFSPSLPPHLLFLLLLAASCGGSPKAASEEGATATGARRAPVPRVIVAEVEQREMVRYLETTSRIESEREISVHPEAGGIVISVLAEEGDEVDAGEALCVLDSRDQDLALRDAEVGLQEAQEGLAQPKLDRAEAEARVQSSLAAWEQAVRDHDRNQSLFEDAELASAVSQQALETSLLAVATARADHEQAKIALERVDLAAQRAATAVSRAEVALSRAEYTLAQRTVRAPFPGTVATRAVRLGQNVGPADAVYILTDLRNIRTLFYRAQEELKLFRPGGSGGEGGGSASLTLEASTDAIPGTIYHGRVLRVSPTIDASSGQFRVTAVFDETEETLASPLLPGMLVRLRIATDRHPDALVVPKRAVRREGEIAYLLVVSDGGVVERVVVREGYDDDERVEVVPSAANSLSAGQRVVSVGSRDLEDGDAVEIETASDE